jgi:hypothetical protein
MKKGQVPRIFQKESILYGKSYFEKEKDRHYSFVQVSVQKIQEIDKKGVDSQTVGLSAPKPLKLYL